MRWRRKDLARWLLETFAISLDETTVGRELKALGFAKISARPRHYAQNELAVEAFKKNFPAELAKIRARLPKGVEIELWWQDEARIGQKNKLTRRWARRGTRPRAPRDQRTEWAYIFGAICPAKGKGTGLVMPWCDTDAMAAHLIEISAAVDPRRPCGADRRSGRLALDAQAGDPRQHHRPGAAATIARVEPGGECLAIHARQLVVAPDLQILRRHRRAVLPSLEQPHRPTMEDHVPRHAQMGAWVLINDRWYKYPIVIKSWRKKWPNLSVYFKYPADIRRVIYTTNAIEAVHRQFRKLTKTKGAFPNENSLLKLLYMGIQNASKKWTSHCKTGI